MPGWVNAAGSRGGHSVQRTDDAPSAVTARGAFFIMREQIETKLGELARRAGVAGTPPAVVAAVLAVCVIVVLGAAWRWWPRDTAPSATASAREVVAADAGGEAASDSGGAAGSDGAAEHGSAGGEAAASATTTAVYVHVVGAVRRPGMYELVAGARVADAVSAAGGLMANAAQAGVNLARVVADGEQITVPTADEFARGAVSGAPAGGGVGGGPAGPSGAAGGSAQVNINTADATALDTLPGVGPSTAAKIVADREANGPFSSADDLGRVAGIGPKKLEELKPRVCVR